MAPGCTYRHARLQLIPRQRLPHVRLSGRSWLPLVLRHPRQLHPRDPSVIHMAHSRIFLGRRGHRRLLLCLSHLRYVPAKLPPAYEAEGPLKHHSPSLPTLHYPSPSHSHSWVSPLSPSPPFLLSASSFPLPPATSTQSSSYSS